MSISESSASGEIPSLNELTELLRSAYINLCISQELSKWLQELGESPHGTIDEQLARIRRHKPTLVLPAEPPARQALFHLLHYDADILRTICQELGIPADGSREQLARRVYYEVGCREGWIPPCSRETKTLFRQVCSLLLQHHAYQAVEQSGMLDAVCDLLMAEQQAMQQQPFQRDAFMAILVPEFYQEAQAAWLQAELARRGIA